MKPLRKYNTHHWTSSLQPTWEHWQMAVLPFNILKLHVVDGFTPRAIVQVLVNEAVTSETTNVAA